ncbi:MAG TPA: DUF4166 domain-containing protein [Pyrinomonadaceae bacterium]
MPPTAAGSGYHRGVADATQTDGLGRAGLYERLVGDDWGELDEPVRRFHTYDGELRGAGTFAVRRGAGRAARLVARLLGLPEGGEAVPLLLSVERQAGGGERWRRSFAGKDFITEQGEHAGRLMAERAGPFELLYRLDAEGGALAYTQVGAALRAGRVRLRLPRRLAPRVGARERAAEGGECVHVCVRVTSPLVGLVIEYEGRVRTEGEAG